MFYQFLKIYARIAIKIYCSRIVINKPEVLKQGGPMLLACNHPNSFLDGMILTTLFDHPVHSLARGDAFKNKWISKFLHQIQLLPVYRTSEGVENLEHNYTTFAACQETFRANEIVLIFSEGRCENEWHLRPLKKGTARLAIAAWNNQIPLKVIPTALNYSSFKRFGKEVHLFFGSLVSQEQVMLEETEGKQLLAFNREVNDQLKTMVYEIEPGDEVKRRKIFSIGRQSSFYYLLLPAVAGWILHAPLFYICKGIAHVRFSNSGHYDSVQTSLLLLSYPFYWLAVSVALYFITPWAGIATLVLMPFLAWAAVQVKYQVDG